MTVIVRLNLDNGVFTTPWGEVELYRGTAILDPCKPGFVLEAGHLLFVSAHTVDELLATDRMVPCRYHGGCEYGSECKQCESGTTRQCARQAVDFANSTVTATTDGSRKFFHAYTETGHWVWVLHEMRFDDEDEGWNLGHQDDRLLVGIYPD